MDELSEDQRAIVARVADLTRNRIAPRAARYDAEGANPAESWRDPWEAGFLAMTVPIAYGGLVKAKYLASEVGLMVTSRVVQVLGGRGAYKDFPAERAFRDLRTSTLMLPNVDRMLDAIGRSSLGIETDILRIAWGPQGA